MCLAFVFASFDAFLCLRTPARTLFNVSFSVRAHFLFFWSFRRRIEIYTRRNTETHALKQNKIFKHYLDVEWLFAIIRALFYRTVSIAYEKWKQIYVIKLWKFAIFFVCRGIVNGVGMQLCHANAFITFSIISTILYSLLEQLQYHLSMIRCRRSLVGSKMRTACVNCFRFFLVGTQLQVWSIVWDGICERNA